MFFRDLQRIVPLLLFMAALPLCAATVTTYDGVDIDLDHSSAESLATIEELRALDRQIVSLFRVSGRRLPLKCRIVISGELPPGELLVELKPREWTLSFNDRGGRWLTDFALRRRLAGMLILSKVPLAEAPAHPDYLPGWIIAGIDERMRAGRESELMLRRNRYMPVLRALSERGTFPDFRQLRNLTPELLTPPARAWYGELGRALLDYGAVCSTPTDNALLDYCILSAKPGSIENQNFLATLGRVFLKDAAQNGLPEHIGRETWDKLSDDEKIQRTLEAYARRLAFNDFFPQPVPITSAAFEALNKLELPVLDEHGLPTGEHTLRSAGDHSAEGRRRRPPAGAPAPDSRSRRRKRRPIQPAAAGSCRRAHAPAADAACPSGAPPFFGGTVPAGHRANPERSREARKNRSVPRRGGNGEPDSGRLLPRRDPGGEPSIAAPHRTGGKIPRTRRMRVA